MLDPFYARQIYPAFLRIPHDPLSPPSQDASCLWQDPRTGRYYAFLKDRLGNNRSRMLAHSDDFRTRSEPQWNITPDHGDHAGTNFYNQSAFKLCVRTLGFPNLYDLTTQTTSARAKSPSRSSAPRREPAPRDRLEDPNESRRAQG